MSDNDNLARTPDDVIVDIPDDNATWRPTYAALVGDMHGYRAALATVARRANAALLSAIDGHGTYTALVGVLNEIEALAVEALDPS